MRDQNIMRRKVMRALPLSPRLLNRQHSNYMVHREVRLSTDPVPGGFHDTFFLSAVSMLRSDSPSPGLLPFHEKV